VRFLLDTHVWLWLQTSPERISRETLGILSDTSNELLLSAASAWEMAVKYAIGKLPLPAPPGDYVPSRMLSSGTAALPVLHVHALLVAELPPHHADPFDRLIIAQAKHETLPVVTADPAFRAYGIDIRPP
jgi:PIN domain nuclease of toxin-antitoxin system